MLNKAQIIGNLGQDVELKYTQNQRPVCSMSVATTKKWKDKNSGDQKSDTQWHKITVWGLQAESCAQYLKKGSKVYVEGELMTRSYDNKDGVKVYVTEINASTVQFLDPKSDSKDQGKYGSKTPINNDNNAPALDQIPF